MHEVLVNRLGGLSLPGKSVVRLTDRPDMTLDVYRGRKTTMQRQQISVLSSKYLEASQSRHFNAVVRTIVVVVFALLFYVHGKHLRSYRDGQLT